MIYRAKNEKIFDLETQITKHEEMAIANYLVIGKMVARRIVDGKSEK